MLSKSHVRIQRCSFIFSALLFSAGCATGSRNHIYEIHPSSAKQLVPQKIDIAFIPQQKNMCGPTVLKMLADLYGSDHSLEDYKKMSFREEAQGAFKSDILSAARRTHLVPYRVRTLTEILQQIDEKHPVIVFQNLGLSWAPAWHFSLLVGYNLSKNEVLLHSGQEAYQKLSFQRFIKTWERGGHWAYVIVPAQVIPSTSSAEEVIENALLFEKLEKNKVATMIYQAMISRWPERFEAYLGLAGLLYKEGKKTEALTHIELALLKSPKNPALLFNAAFLHQERGNHKQALKLKAEALRTVPNDDQESYRQRFGF